MPRFAIRVAPDGMAAFLVLPAGLGELPSDDELRAALARAGVVAGFDEAALTRLRDGATSVPTSSGEIQIATALPAEPGRDGWLELGFEQGPIAGSVSADGHLDFRERHWLKPVVAGQVLAVVRPPEAGRPGRRVDGHSISARAGQPLKLKLGTGVEADAAGKVCAKRDGVVLYKAGEGLDVVDTHVHQGSVDVRTGHLDMNGSLSVQGDVERLLQVRASGDVEVRGSVSGGSVRAGGSVNVSGSVRGGDDARIVAGADITLKSCEASEVTARGTLSVHEAVNSALSGHRVLVSGRIRGGSAVAETTVRVTEAGTTAGIATLLQAGEPLELPDLEQVQRAVVMQKLRRMAERGGVRDAFGSRGDARGKGGKLGRIDAVLSQEELAKVAQRAERRAQLQRSAVLELGTAHAGVELRIGAAHLTLERTVKGVRYFLSPETGQLSAERTTT